MLTSKFIERTKNIHNNLYEYEIIEDKVVVKDKIIAVCDNHGRFLTRIHDYIYHKTGCSQCVNESNIRHNNLYKYHKVNYINSKEKVEIICDKHGSFWQTPEIM